jgi:hypothetical protein
MKVRQGSRGRWNLAAIGVSASILASTAMAAEPVRGVTDTEIVPIGAAGA